MLLLSTTETPTVENIFQEKKAFWILSLSILWSIRTLFILNLKYIKIQKVYCPMMSQISVLVWTVFSVSKRLLVLVMYFTPSLGLFSLLYHWKAESIPFAVSQKSKWREGMLSQSQHLHLHNNRSVLWSEIDRWDYSASPSPPPYTLYTGLSLRTYFWLFLAILGLHTLAVGIAKFILVPDFRKAHPVQMFSHCLQSISLPEPWRPWDTDGGNVEQHRERFRREITEMVATLAVNFVVNVSMLGPFLHLGRKCKNYCIN